jgi:Zn-dependent peptidase ImmA (M78 family)
MPGDRQRFSIAHELGHLMLRPKGLDDEKAAHRFAAAFLVPEAAVKYELRGKRIDICLYELHLLKHKYGLSMQAWIYRAKDLGIISDERAAAIFKRFRALGRHKREPGGEIPLEWPMRFEILVNLALAEEAISKRRAEELLNKPVETGSAKPGEDDEIRAAVVCD